MNLKFLFLLLSVCLFSTVANGQEKKLNVEVALSEMTIWTISKDVSVKVKITNTSERVLDKKEIGDIVFMFSKRAKNALVYVGEMYLASGKLKSKKLKPGESFEDKINLADLYWSDAASSIMDLTFSKNFIGIASADYHFFARVISFESNEIEVKINPRSSD
jgi:hypothetical protein